MAQTYQDTREQFGFDDNDSSLNDFYNGVFGESEPEDDSWDGTPAPKGQPGQNGAQGAEQQNNDEVRYQYWQSQHDQLKNQYSTLEKENRALMERLGNLESNLNKKPEPEVEEEMFPDPPAPPQKPYDFSQVAAMSDPSSSSAQYLIQLSEYNNNMNQYNLLRNQWVEAKSQERINALYEQRKLEESEAARRAETSAAINQVIAGVQQKYGIDYNAALDFVNTMSDPSSISVDNLFELYKMKKGAGQTRFAPTANPKQQFNPFGASSQPSLDFQQRQRAQSIPPTMGVHNAQGNENVDPMIRAFQQVVANSNKNSIY